MLSTRRCGFVSALIAASVLAACGGGFSLYIDGSDFDEYWPPSVSLAAAQTTVLAGQSVRLAAAARSAVAPTDGRTALLVFARATDNAGNRADSGTVSIAISP